MVSNGNTNFKTSKLRIIEVRVESPDDFRYYITQKKTLCQNETHKKSKKHHIITFLPFVFVSNKAVNSLHETNSLKNLKNLK